MKDEDNDVFIIVDNLTTPLGLTTAQNFNNLQKGATGVKQHINPSISSLPFSASVFSNDIFNDQRQYTKFEQMLIASVSDALQQSGLDAHDDKLIFIISTTKGNISLLQDANLTPELQQRVALHTSAKLIKQHFGFVNTPIIVSSACISGISAILTGARLLRQGTYRHAVVAGADEVSKFVVNGFQSFQALSPNLCRPFDEARIGINLGEGAATVVLSVDALTANDIKVAGGATSDDANHISGPSRTGEELGTAILTTLTEAELKSTDIDMISAHGTATIYNDEMEASAITFAGLNEVPLNSLKGFYGHTLGAAGIIESVVTINAMQNNLILPTPGFDRTGTTPVNVAKQIIYKPVNHALKTASGFGGCNAAIIYSKQ